MATLARPSTIPEDGLAGPGARISIVPPLPSERKRQSGGIQKSIVPQTLMRRDASQGLNIAQPKGRVTSTRRNITGGGDSNVLTRDHSKGLVKAPQRNNLDENLQTSLVKQAIEKRSHQPKSPTSIWDTVTTSLFGSGEEEVDPDAIGGGDGLTGDRLDVSHWQKMAKAEAKKEKREQKENRVN